jgi:DNA topoisomerase-1
MTCKSPKYLVIVESPAKTKKIEGFLGSDYTVQASFGHIMDLDSKNLSIDVNNNFEPHYIVNPDKKKVVTNLLYHKTKCDQVIIASDMDFEGEFIGYSIQKLLNLQNPKRIIFNQITKSAILDAISKPTELNITTVQCQQVRRITDRILGYLLSPLLQKYLQAGLSAGRTQSVGVRIIIDKENEVNESIQNIIDKPFFKSISEFKYNDIKLEATLVNNKENYKIESKELAIEILNKLDKKNVCKIISADVEETKRHPPPAHTTATIMQEASSKLGMNIKRCNDNLQKLYEASKISYHRTDSTSLSKEYVGMTKEYINKNYGENYYKYREYKNKDESAQNAHEAIRNIYPEENIEGEGITTDMQRLYKLIFQRATASLMKEALIDVQTVLIDILTSSLTYGSNNSILPDNSLYQTKFEEIKFYGFLAIYDNKSEKSADSEENENKKGLLNIITDGSTNTIINHINTDMIETFNTPILRHNEAGFIKYLKKSGVGRPSTYSAIISKIIERNYVEIKNIDGIEKDVITLSVSNKKYNTIKEKSKKVKIGAEKNKICPTELGYKTNEFLMKHFNNVINVEFTSGLEEKMDMVAENKAKWFNVVGEFYNMINPIVIKLNTDAPQKSLTDAYSANDKNLGEHNGNMIYLTKSRYGWCVKIMENDTTKGWRYGNIGDIKPEEVTLEQAIEFLKYPKDIGKIGSSNVILCKGKFGPYFKIGAKLVGIKDKEINIDDKNDEELLELAKELNEGNPTDSTKSSLPNNTYMIGKTKVYLKEGDNGPYLMVPHGNGDTRKPTFISIPKGTDRTKLTATKIKEIMDNHKKQKTEGYKSYKGQDPKWKK